MKKLKVIVGWEEGNYSALCNDKDINGIVVDTHKNLEALKNSFSEVMKFHIEGCQEDGDILPEYLTKGEYELYFEMQVSAILPQCDGILTRAALSRVTGINERQLGHYMTGRRTPRPQQRERIISGIRCIGKELSSVV